MATTTLHEQRQRVWSAYQRLLEQSDSRPMTGEESQAEARMNAELDDLDNNIRIRDRAAQRAAAYDAPGEAPVSTRSVDRPHPATPEGKAGTAAARYGVYTSGDDGETDYRAQREYARAFDRYLRRGITKVTEEQRALLDAEYRDLSIGTNSAGGYTVPPGFIDKITDAMKAYGGMLDVCNVIRTDSGQPLQWPTADDTSNTGAILAENTGASTQDITFGTKTLSAYMYTSKMVKVSYQLLNDSAFDLSAWLPKKFGQRLGRAINAHFTNGTGGGSQPTGLVPNLTVGKTGTTGQTLTVIYDDLVDVIHSVDPAYRPDGRWMMADSSVKVVRKLKDTQGHPLWEPSVQAGVPDSLLGYPLTVNQDFPVMAANAKSIAFGNFTEAYVIREVQGVQTLRLDERFADALQVGFLSFARYDGTPDDLNAAKLYQNSAT